MPIPIADRWLPSSRWEPETRPPAAARLVGKPRSRLDIPRGGLRRSVRYRPRNGIVMVHMFLFGHGAPRLTAVHLRVASLFKVVPQCGSNVKNTKQISWQARAGSLAKKVKLQNKDPDRPVPRPDECALHIGWPRLRQAGPPTKYENYNTKFHADSPGIGPRTLKMRNKAADTPVPPVDSKRPGVGTTRNLLV